MMRSGFLAAALLALPCAAMADTAGTIPIGRDGVAGTFQETGETQTWAVRLYAGHDYALAADSSDVEIDPVAVRAAGGGTLCSGRAGEPGGPGLTGGCSFRAPYNGLYTVTVTATGDFHFRAAYRLRVTPDCRADRATRCDLDVGDTRSEMRFDYDTDRDWFAVGLVAGRDYTVSANSTNPYNPEGLDLRLRGPNGSVLRSASAAQAETASVTYTPARTGTYYVETVNESEDGSQGYSLSLARVR